MKIKTLSSKDPEDLVNKIESLLNNQNEELKDSKIVYNSRERKYVCFLYFTIKVSEKEVGSKVEPTSSRFKPTEIQLIKMAETKPTLKQIKTLKKMKMSEKEISQMSRLNAWEIINNYQDKNI